MLLMNEANVMLRQSQLINSRNRLVSHLACLKHACDKCPQCLSSLKLLSPVADEVLRTRNTQVFNIMPYMARQPILDADEQTAGYEFLYRDAAESVANFPDLDTASRNVLRHTVLLVCRVPSR